MPGTGSELGAVGSGGGGGWGAATGDRDPEGPL